MKEIVSNEVYEQEAFAEEKRNLDGVEKALQKLIDEKEASINDLQEQVDDFDFNHLQKEGRSVKEGITRRSMEIREQKKRNT